MISRGQFLVLFVLCRMFVLMTYVPLMGEGYTVTTQMLAAAVSTALIAAASFPIIMLMEREKGKSFISLLNRKGSFGGKLLVSLYILFALALSVQSAAHFLRFILQVFFPGGSVLLISAAFLLVCFYASYVGTESLARTSSVVFAVFVLMTVSTIFLSFDDWNMARIITEQTAGANGFTGALFEELSRNSQLLLLPFFYHKVRGGARQGFFMGLSIQLVLLELFSLMMTSAMGLLIKSTDYPFFSMISNSGRSDFGRMDAFYILVWTLSAVVYTGIFLTAAKEALVLECKLSHKSIIFFALLTYAGTAAILAAGEDFYYVLRLLTGGAFVVLLYFIIPLILLIGGRLNAKSKKDFSHSVSSSDMRGADGL